MTAPADGLAPPVPEPVFTRAQAVRTPAFWFLSLYGLLIWPVQAGVSLHQAPNLIERGLDSTVAATVVSTFSAMSALAGFGVGFIGRRVPLGVRLAVAAALVGASALAMSQIAGPFLAYLSAAMFGLGLGGMFTLLPVAWADLFGRRSFGAIRGIALAIQVLAQAAGPLLSGILRDRSGSYDLSLLVLRGPRRACRACRPPRPPAGASRGPREDADAGRIANIDIVTMTSRRSEHARGRRGRRRSPGA